MNKRQILFLLRKAPYQSSQAIEAVEAALVAGVFEQEVSVLFKDDGVWQLVDHQNGSDLGVRCHGKVLQALPEYDVTNLFVCEPSMRERRLSLEDMVLNVVPLSFAQQRQLLAGQHAVLND